MLKKLFLFGLILLMPCLVFPANTPSPLIDENSPLPDGAGGIPLIGWNPTDDPIGEVFLMGTTWYDYQHNGSCSKQITLDGQGAVQIAWMNGLNSGASQRHIWYNYFASGAPGSAAGWQVDNYYKTGYTTLDVNSSNISAVFYHGMNSATDSTKGVLGRNTSYLASTFNNTIVPSPTPLRGLTWPHGVVDHQGNIHMVLQTNPNTTLFYTRSTNGGTSFDVPTPIANTTGMAAISQTMAASPLDGHIAIVYTHPLTTLWQDENVLYFQSDANGNFNFANPPVNITNFGQPGHPMTNGCRAWSSCNAIYDSTGSLHIVYSTLPYPTPTSLVGASILWHWSEMTGHTKIAGELTWGGPYAYNRPGAWHLCWDLPSLGFDANGDLYCIWEQCTTPGDSSQGGATGGYGNFDVYASYSTDGGDTWMAPVNVTDTHSPLGVPGQCMSEAWPTLAKKVDSYLHIEYIQDKDAGGIPQSEGTWTQNPVVYQKVPVTAILTDLTLTAIPTVTPIVIPPTGGSFTYTATLHNNTTHQVIGDFHTEAILPAGSTYGPILMRPNITLVGSGTVARTLTQNIPASAPAGNYTYRVVFGDQGWNEWIVAEIPFTKSAGDNTGGGNWNITGWDDNPLTAVSARPESHILLSASPNPFNPTTEINYTLSDDGDVKIAVYDVSGRETAVLHNGYHQAGNYSLTFNAGNLSSGVYFITLISGKEVKTTKALLMK